MAATETGERRTDLKTQLIERLHDPLQLRIFVLGLVLAAGYFGVYSPLVAQIDEAKDKLSHEQKRAELAANIEQLQARCSRFAKRIPQQTDGKEWLQYMHEGIRRFPVRLTKLDYLSPRQVGPYRAAVLTVALEGSFFDLDQFLRWIEANPRLLRVDDIGIGLVGGNKNANNAAAADDRDNMTMQLTVLGLGN
jgi:Tfp pilus assembly protein PilO